MKSLEEHFDELPKGWQNHLAPLFSHEKMKDLWLFLEEEKKTHNIFPPENDMFKALQFTDFDQVVAVIIGQDPYHGPEQAHGLSFSVKKGVVLPPSLKNIYQELESDVGISKSVDGNLSSWANQGILMLNASLTVRQKEPNSHARKGWEFFTDYLIDKLISQRSSLIFLLWGKYAQQKCRKVLEVYPQHSHYILEAPHPSPFSARTGFFGCRHFSLCNSLLKNKGKKIINW